MNIAYICDEETTSFCEVLQSATGITELDLKITHTRLCCAKELALQINQCTKISYLRLYYSGSFECIQIFVSSLSPSISQCWSLSLEKLDSQCIQALGNGLQHLHTSSLLLTVTESDINEDGWTCLVDGLQNTKSLGLDLSHNNIDSSVITPLVESLNTLQLNGLDLSRNNIGLCGVVALSGGLEELTGLTWTMSITYQHWS